MNIKNKIEELQKEGINSNCYYLINSKKMTEVIDKCSSDKNKLKDFYDLCEGWDKYGSAIPLEIGNKIEELIYNPNIQVGIHRSSVVTGMDDMGLIYLTDIMQNGLQNNAQLSQGAVHDIPRLPLTVSMVNDMFHAMPLLKTNYKGSNGSIIFALPKSCLDEEGNILNGYEDEIYNKIGNTYHIKPEYIVGYLVAEYGVYNLYTKEDILSRGR